MRKLIFVLIITIIFGVSVPATMAADDCSLSFATRLAPNAATSGQIAGAFSTHRDSPGAVDGTKVYAPARFTVLDQRCVAGLSWVQLRYVTGVDENGAQASALGVGWALESQVYPDYFNDFGAGYWLSPASDNQGGGSTPPPASNDCSLSLATEFANGSGTGRIAAAFSTHRAAPAAFDGVRVYAPATFDVLDQRCVGGYSWVQLEYTSGLTASGAQASSLGVGWALESEVYADYYNPYGAGRWLTRS